jgi:hypothetical protein
MTAQRPEWLYGTGCCDQWTPEELHPRRAREAAVTALRPWALCPRCHARLDGGPVIWWCPNGHGEIHGSALDPERQR